MVMMMLTGSGDRQQPRYDEIDTFIPWRPEDVPLHLGLVRLVFSLVPFFVFVIGRCLLALLRCCDRSLSVSGAVGRSRFLVSYSSLGSVLVPVAAAVGSVIVFF
ncbi:hypothetical protein VPH35_099621 [Triticum aestivum]|uniref:Uncharacterized protein n=1 Tax=Aegilops tauschii TaxID=37682 RepID=M8BPN7_AEGTA